MGFEVYATSEAWISLCTLIFLEIVLGIDNLVFIAITTGRLPENKQHIGRRLGLLGALCMRIMLLCVISWIIHLAKPLFTLDWFIVHGQPYSMSWRDLVLVVGGIYLIYKGIAELKEMLNLTEQKAEVGHEGAVLKKITLPRAVGTIMIMDVVFSLDSVITAAGLSGELVIMIPAVMIAVAIMIVFADPISNFINNHAQIKILALVFITTIGLLLVCEGLEVTSEIEILGMQLENLIVYCAMAFSLVLELIQMRYTRNLARFQKALRENAEDDSKQEAEIVRAATESTDGSPAAKAAESNAGDSATGKAAGSGAKA